MDERELWNSIHCNFLLLTQCHKILTENTTKYVVIGLVEAHMISDENFQDTCAIFFSNLKSFSRKKKKIIHNEILGF